MLDSYRACSYVRIDQVKLVLVAVMQSDTIHSRHKRIELDNNRLIPEYTSSIRFGIVWTSTVKFLWLSTVVGWGIFPASTSNWSLSTIFMWVKLRFCANFSRHRRTELDSCRLIPEI
jgi:hypothetical protein